MYFNGKTTENAIKNCFNQIKTNMIMKFLEK